ncbi:PREDICTED: uncharacterized protein LOC109129866 [Camelina sativa]|uniref:Uncharacterized protein LOC109129866 n=1 Tax=Camelina sativa TaxID=90675 RepID=A0ABM1R5V4_CAMSA|nr:PREDICTED: uncharacterized protein LOC109129866 [Camelina sativa]
MPGEQSSIIISVVYASNAEDQRKELWKEIVVMGTSQLVSNKPWILLGDFNQILHPHEHSRYLHPNVDHNIRDFKSCLLDAELADLVFRGNSFTWWNKNKERPVAKKLDRILVNESWNIKYPSSLATFGEPDFSDHASCGVTLDATQIRAKRPFKFYNYLFQNAEFITLIRANWFSLNIVGSAMYRVSKKLKSLKKPIKDFSRQNYSDLEKRTLEAHENLLSCQRSTLADPTATNAMMELEAQTKWTVLAAAEESFFYQKSRVTWFAEGDGNTRYFHRMADSRKAINTIHCMKDDHGNSFDTQEEITSHCADYFENLLTEEEDPCTMEQADMDLLLTFRCSPAQKTDVISPSQSAFLPGRSLAENVLLATKLVHGYNWRNISPRGMLKVDLRKAFDSVRWDFVISALRAIQVPQRFIDWVYQCISTPTFTVSVNGCNGGFFKSSKGLRQGDPLSPYLFVLAMEVFSKLLQSRYDAGYIHYHPQALDPSISHLMFADDVMIFFDGGHSSLHGICETLDDFASWSGLKVNRDKSQLFHAGLNTNECNEIVAYGFPQGTLPIRYMGLPLMHRKLKIAEYEPLLEKLTSRFRSWATKSLSFTGRLQLISTVIFGSINFWMSTFLLPKGCIQKIESLCAKFLWSGNIDEVKGAKVAWETVCLPKTEGGLGLRRLTEWNKTLNLRLIWSLFKPGNSLWSAWNHQHHIRNSTFWAVTSTNKDSASWKTLLSLRPLAAKFIKCRVGNGRRASFWYDNWTSLGPLINRIGDHGDRSLRIPLLAKVADAILNEEWKLPLTRSDPARAILDHLRTLPIPNDHS